MRPINRPAPRLPVQAMKTYSISAPLTTHFRPASCEEVDCPAYLHGWKTKIDDSTVLGTQQRDWIRSSSGRRFTEEREATGLLVFDFPAEQQCFKRSEHRIRLDRPERYFIRGGDFRGQIGQAVEHKRPELWVESFAENQDRIITVQKKG